MTEKDPSDAPIKTFVNMAEQQSGDLTEDEKMQRIAEEMERKFKEGGVQSVTTVNNFIFLCYRK